LKLMVLKVSKTSTNLILQNSIPVEVGRTICVNRSDSSVCKELRYRDRLSKDHIRSVQERFDLLRRKHISPLIHLKFEPEAVLVTSRYKPARLKLKECDQQILAKALQTFSLKVRKLNKIGLVLGDCVPKNLRFDGIHFWLIDFEPFTEVALPSGQIKLMSTKGWCNLADVAQKKLSCETDSLCLNQLKQRFLASDCRTWE